uniref:Uncharacterized protein n=1 Tax=Rhizophora mucronata TaxID=61149 RepID=A0A2P2MF31_RHIMU
MAFLFALDQLSQKL